MTTIEAKKYCLKGPSENGQSEDLLDGMNDKESRQRLQALIAEWLRMENLVCLECSWLFKGVRWKGVVRIRRIGHGSSTENTRKK